jgi:energy-coupling factor transporter ATP-binding protein EcfA2
MSTRRELLTSLFQLLEQRQISYCVLRNYDRLLEEQPSDVDLLTLPAQANAVLAICQEAARQTGYLLVQQARFVNHSLVFWNEAASFVRIDVDTEKRWKRFHLLTAAQILATRRRRENFYIPAAAHEAVIVLTQALWQGQLTERYARRLEQLRTELNATPQVNDIIAAAFGWHGPLLDQIADPALPQKLRRAVQYSVCRQPGKTLRSLGYVIKDALRLFGRRAHPPGAFLRMIGVDTVVAAAVAEKLAVLFPVKKSTTVSGAMAAQQLQTTRFKGGLAIELLPPSPKPAARLRHDWPELPHSFAVVAEAGGAMHFIHVGSGRMALGHDAAALAHFICRNLAQRYELKPAARRGCFAVLIGLDGAGKTTLARHLASLAATEPALAGVRYFHWLPPMNQALEFPLPEPGNQPRKPVLARGLKQSSLSVLRLGKNLLRAQLAWWLCLRGWRQRGHLVLVDRYFYNYYLDPVSVKYYGPRWVLDCLTRFFPKPEIVITLSAPPEVLLQRKQELTEIEMRAQAVTLQKLQFPTRHVIAADAAEAAPVVAQKTMAALRKILA